jgi:hypothetical protein
MSALMQHLSLLFTNAQLLRVLKSRPSRGAGISLLALCLGASLSAGAAPAAADSKMVLHDNVKLVSKRKVLYPQILMAYVRWHEDLCKGLGRPVVRFDEADLGKVFGEETTAYFSGGKRLTQVRSWTLAWMAPSAREDKKCDFSLVNHERIEVVTDELNVLFQLHGQVGKTEVLNKSAPTVQRAKQERAERLAQLTDANSLWARRVFADRGPTQRVNGIPCVMTSNGLGCLFEKMPYHVPSGKPLVIQSGLISPAIQSRCEDTPLESLKKSYTDLAVCALQATQEATEIQLDVAMPPDAFEIPQVAKAHPIKSLN